MVRDPEMPLFDPNFDDAAAVQQPRPAERLAGAVSVSEKVVGIIASAALLTAGAVGMTCGNCHAVAPGILATGLGVLVLCGLRAKPADGPGGP